MEYCPQCPAGAFCPGNSTFPGDCPLRSYCPEGTALPILCPNGTYGAQVNLSTPEDCSSCPPGYYCVDGTITAECSPGYFCRSGQSTPTPEQDLSAFDDDPAGALSHILSTNGGQCPPGHYCYAGTYDPFPCENTTVRLDTHGASPDDCGPCPAGYMCFDGDPVPDPCNPGQYCPLGESSMDCPPGHYNPFYSQSSIEDCLVCPKGYFCNASAISKFSDWPCPTSQYCLNGTLDPLPCPAGTYRNDYGADSMDACYECPAGYYCPRETDVYYSCPEKTYCPPGSTNTTVCPTGYYCPVNSGSPLLCPENYYCPQETAVPLACYPGTYCPNGTAYPMQCALGHKAVDESNFTLEVLHSEQTACEACSPGEYGIDADRLVCEICTPGYVCLGATTSATPTSEIERGYICPKGSYCPEGSSLEIKCPVGHFQPNFGESNVSACLPCEADYYQNEEGQDACYSCSTSSSSEAAATTCTCEGKNRIFQPQDGWCICKPGFEYVNSDLEVLQEGDGVYDCQPIVYDRCAEGQSRTSGGDCVDPESHCLEECGEEGGTFLEAGECECNGIQTLDEICDEDCRAESLQTRCVDGNIEVFDPVTDEAVDIEMSEFDTEGSIDCSTEGASIYSMGTNNGTFTGTFGAGSSLSDEISRRRRRLSAKENSGLTLPSNFLRTSNSQIYESAKGSTDNSSSMGGPILSYFPIRRNLANVSATNSSGIITNPIVCMSLGDSLVFDITNENYPTYDKDSLFNSNPNYDYSEFRSLASTAASSLEITTFSTTFSESGTYAFRMSSAQNKLLLVAVMPANVNCSLESFFVTFTASNLITLGIDTNDDIVLAPDWDLVMGLLGGMLALVLILIGFVYFFRKRAWTSHKVIHTKYRHQQRNTKTKDSTKGGHMTKGAKAGKSGNDDDSKRLEKKDSFYSEFCLEDLEAAALANESAAIEFDDDMMVPELAAHIQKNHDGIDRQMHIQNDRLSEIADSLKKEVDDIKSMIVTTAQGGGFSTAAHSGNRLNAVVSRLRADVTQRTAYEHAQQATEARIRQALIRLQNLLDEGPTVVAGKIVDEVSEQAEVVYQRNNVNDSQSESILLHDMVRDLEEVKEYIDSSLSQLTAAEERRQKNAASTFESNLRDSSLKLSQAILNGVHKCTQAEFDIDQDTTELLKAFRAFAGRSPKFVAVMIASEGELVRELLEAMDVGNPSKSDSSKERIKSTMENHLHDLWKALKALLGKVEGKREALTTSRQGLEVNQMELNAAIDEFLAEQPARGNEEELMRLLNELRGGNMMRASSSAISESMVYSQMAGIDEVDNVVQQAPLMSISEDLGDSLTDMQEHIEDAIMKNDKFSVDIKEELIGGSESDANVISSIMQQEKELHMQALHNLDMEKDQSQGQSQDEEANLAEKHEQEAKELLEKIEKEHKANLNAMIRSEELEGGSESEKKLQSYLSARYATRMRLHGVKSRQLFAELNLDFMSRRVSLLTDGDEDGGAKLYDEEREAMNNLLTVIAKSRSSIAVEEDELREKWEANLSEMNIDESLVEFVTQTRSHFTDLKDRVKRLIPKLQAVIADDAAHRVICVKKRIANFSEPLRKDSVQFLELETKYCHDEATLRMQQHLHFLEATEHDVNDILEVATSWERTSTQRLQQSDLHDRIITSMYSNNDSKCRLNLVENMLKCEAKEMKLFSDLSKLGTNEIEVSKFIREQRDSDKLTISYLQKQVTLEGQKAVALEKERHADAVVDHEKELAYAIEMNTFRQYEFQIEADLSRRRALTEVTDALAAKRGFLVSRLREKNLPHYILEEASMQVDAEIQRERCELDAAYFSIISSLMMMQMHASAMVEGKCSDIKYSKAWTESSYRKEMTAYWESFGNEVERRKHKAKVQAHSYAETEAERLMLLGRSAAELEAIHDSIHNELEAALITISDDVHREWQRMEAQQNGNHDDVIQIQEDYDAVVKSIHDNRERDRQQLMSSLASGKQTLPADEFVSLEGTTAAGIVENYRTFCLELCEAFKSCQTRQLCLEQAEDSLRDLRNKKQQEVEALEDSFSAQFGKSAAKLTKKQVNYRDTLNELRNEYERSLIGLEEQFKHQREKAHKFLQDRLARERARREKELMKGGQSPSQAKQQAQLDCEAYETAQKEYVDNLLQEKEEETRQILFSDMTEKVADAEMRKKLLKESIPNGLEHFKKKERKSKENDLLEKARDYEKSLIDEGMDKEAASVAAKERFEADRQIVLASLTESQKPVLQSLTDALNREAGEEIRRLHDGWPDSKPRHELQAEEEKILKSRDDSIAALVKGLNERAKEKRALLKAAFDKARRACQEKHQAEGMSAPEAAQAAKKSLSAGEQKGISDLEDEINAIKERIENAIDRDIEDRLHNLKHDYAKSCDGLEFALQVKQAAYKKNLHNRLDKRRAQRKDALLKSGLPEHEVEERLTKEFANGESRLDEVLNEMKEDMLNEKMIKDDKLSKMERDESADEILATTEDEEARALRQRLAALEEDFMRRKESDSFSTSDAARHAAKESYGQAESLIQSLRDSHTAACKQLDDSLKNALDKERKALELQKDLAVAEVQESKMSKSEKAKKIIDIQDEHDKRLDAIASQLQTSHDSEKFKLNKKLEDDIKRIIDAEHEKASKASNDKTAAMNAAMEKVHELQKMQEMELNRLQEQLLANQRALESELKDKVLKRKSVEEDTVDALREKMKSQEEKALQKLSDKHSEILSTLNAAVNNPDLDDDSRRLAMEKVTKMRKEQENERKRLDDKLSADRRAREKSLKERLTKRRAHGGRGDESATLREANEFQDEMDAKAMKNLKDEQDAELAIILAAANDSNLDDKSRRLAMEKVERMRKEHDLQQQRLEDQLKADRLARENALKERLAKRSAGSGENEEEMEAEAMLEALANQEEIDKMDAVHELRMKQLREKASAECSLLNQDLSASDREELKARVDSMQQEQIEERKRLENDLLASMRERENALAARLAKRRSKPMTVVDHAIREVIEHGKDEENKAIQELEQQHVAALEAAAAVANQPDMDENTRQQELEKVARMKREQEEERNRLENKLLFDRRAREKALKERLKSRRSKKSSTDDSESLSQSGVQELIEIAEEVTAEELRKNDVDGKEEARRLSEQKKSLKNRFAKIVLKHKSASKGGDGKVVEDDAAALQKVREAAQQDQERLLAEMERKHNEQMQAAMMEARQMEIDAATAAAKEKALEAEKLIKERLAEELNSQELKRMHEEHLREAKKHQDDLIASQQEGKKNLKERLAEKRLRKEKELREKEESALAELKKKQEVERQEKEKLRQAKMVWSERLAEAAEKADKAGLTGLSKEDFCFKETIGKKLVPESHLSEIAQAIMKDRHSAAMTELLNTQYKNRVTAIKSAIEKVMTEKAEARIDLVDKLVSRKSTDDFIKVSLADLDTKYSAKQIESEEAAVLILEREHMKNQMDLRQKQLEEISTAINMYSDAESLAKLSEMSGVSKEDELIAYRNRLEAEKKATEKKLLAEREANEAKLRSEYQANLEQVREKLDNDRKKEEAEIEEKKKQLFRQKKEFEKKQADESGRLNQKEKQRILETFEKEINAANEALTNDKKRRKMNLEQRLAARKKKSTPSKELDPSPTSPVIVPPAPSFSGPASTPQHQVSTATLTATTPELSHVLGVVERKLGQIDALIKTQANDSLKLERMNQLLMSLEGDVHSDHPGSPKKGGLTDKLRQKLKKGSSRTSVDGSGEAAVHMHTIEDKLDRLLQSQKLSDATSSPASGVVYYDEGNPPQGEELSVIPQKKLSGPQNARIAFGVRLAEMVGIDAITINPVTSLPPSQLVNNAFKNSYHYNHDSKELFIHVDRLASSGDFGLVCIHALSHIKLSPNDLSNDNDPSFMSEFYTNLRLLSRDLYMNINSTANSTAQKDSTVRSRNTSIASGMEDEGIVMNAEYFNKQRMHERLRQYIGGQGVVPTSFLDRYNKDSEDRSTK